MHFSEYSGFTLLENFNLTFYQRVHASLYLLQTYFCILGHNKVKILRTHNYIILNSIVEQLRKKALKLSKVC